MYKRYSKKISVDVPIEMLDKVDKAAKWMYMSRSEYIRLAMWHATSIIGTAKERNIQDWHNTKLSEYLKELMG